MTPTPEAHPLRCETCNRKIGCGGTDDCPISIPSHMDDPDIYIVCGRRQVNRDDVNL